MFLKFNLSLFLCRPCNESGLTDPQSTKGWGIVDFDWSNAKKVWAAAKPMNCEEMLVDQVQKTTSASPGTTVWVYRNGIKALPWYTLVRKKVTDPTYAAWFMKFSPAVIANHSAAHVPVCDANYDPPRCSDLYHDQVSSVHCKRSQYRWQLFGNKLFGCMFENLYIY